MTDIWLKECQKNMKNNNSQKEKKSIEYQSNVVLNRFKSHENSSVFRKSIFLINVQASMKENKEKKIKSCDEISKLIKAFPKDIAALDKRSVLAKVNSQGSGR